ncbi:DUF4367 domain-containing protein [Rossellomorea aquimaris]|uniref:DUF4367 domain-containing protein n=1 Tax=Rossellomorea aquimaris TaxID=189382 RepID=UPI0007D07905|nr:DUF4367 domain-containing protein [Rossellomorea aquimaris]
MKKKRVIIFTLLLGAITVLLVGWSVSRGKMYDYNYSEVAEKMESTPFNARFPTKVPFEEMRLYDFGSKNQEVEFTLFNVDKEFLTIKITKDEIEYPEGIKKENIKIGSDLKGKYIPEHYGSRIIFWEDEELSYEITFRYKFTPIEVSKEQLIKMAESFK